ncbi:septum formation inhibitor Maf [Flavobacterium sp. 7A]|uniref:septum formation inhibitor Maf n=1 Tax=Flavobacterium sp. 7A TaxID=2940571 RepID=UPI002225CB33|nr:septum formation inhibitor Maf [Flavobacterium sp. 7A]MCW2119564.1 hypothetical protein [Flavobacterium sp. 7A]
MISITKDIKLHLKTLCLFTMFSVMGCKPDKNLSNELKKAENSLNVVPTTKQFNDYWYSGKAELKSYELKQSRYGEIHKGEVILVFVTEAFSLSKQAKLDNPQDAGSDNVTVMKLNNIRKFTTGIYDYAILTSTFTPIDSQKHPYTLKSNTSMQEWCGHVFSQLNLKGKKYEFQQFSYFETEGDMEKDIPVALLEEELMTRMRLNQGQLPLGKMDLIFSTLYSRFTHKELEVSKAKISKTETDTALNYKIEYLMHDRKVAIEVQKAFPYKILSWTEDDGDGLITEAILKKSINEPYWNQKGAADKDKRRELELMH